MQRIQAGIESVAKGMDYMGERAGELIGPGIPLQIDTAAAVKEQRIFDEQYTVGKHPVITLSNEFGAIRVSTWDENIVRINAEITAGAQSQEIAEQIVQTIDISVSHKEDFIECHTVYPEIKSDDQLFQSVNYNIQIPKDAALVVDNFFGDVYLSDIGGTVAANVQYG
ncbi:MAG: hypothetical protein KAH38_02610, partial [Candidatus Hydrogenedentes bacterium]|nr:hypothetical protein [Candidatus Hydrogenedentota bacterium]